MSNDTPSWSGDDAGSTPPPPPPPPPAASYGAGEVTWSEGSPGAGPVGGGLAKRFGARIIDGLIVGIPVGLVLIFGMGFDPAGYVYSILTAVLNLAYFVFLESSQGGTLGKRLLSMTVTSVAGQRISAEQAFRRNWWLLLGLVPVIGPLASLGITIYIAVTISGDPANRGFHDKMADAVVLDR